MIYLIITASINTKYYNIHKEHRKQRYIESITAAVNLTKNDPDIKVIAVENNGARATYLDGLGCDVLYTNNNTVVCQHKGINELLDIKEVIRHYGIADDDIVIKLTGRYRLLDDLFLRTVKENMDRYDAFIKFFNVCALRYMRDDCVLGLFAIRCKYLRSFEYACKKSPECEFANLARKEIGDKVMELTNLQLECCFADNLRKLVV
jgi:hypothetical protein